MKKGRQTRLQPDAEIETTVVRKKQIAEEVAEIFVKELLRKDVKNALSDLSDEALKQTARNIADILLREADKVEREVKETNMPKMLYSAKNDYGVRSTMTNEQGSSQIIK